MPVVMGVDARGGAIFLKLHRSYLRVDFMAPEGSAY